MVVKIKNVIVGQSGGPTAVINASVAGVYKKAKELGYNKVYGMENGIEGFLEERLIDLDKYLKSKDNFELLKRTPSAFLGSCRFKLPKYEDDKCIYEKIFSLLEKYDIDLFFYIGGNDSMDTIKMLSDYAILNNKKQKFVGIPKTIDNDLPITDHCPGYGSASKYIATSLKEIIRDNASFDKNRQTVCIVEIMGRHAGWLTASSILSKDSSCEGVDAIYLPEISFDIDKFVLNVKKLISKKASVVIAVSEGLQTSNGKFVCEEGTNGLNVDAFGHKQLSGCAKTLSDIVSSKLGVKTRVVEFSTLQRAASHMASLVDIKEAQKVGEKAVSYASSGKTGVMVVMKRKNALKYSIKYECYDIHKIANVEKKIPLDWIDTNNNTLTDEFISYVKPLIMGNLTPVYEDGLPKHLIK